jgi:hypothetical protein
MIRTLQRLGICRHPGGGNQRLSMLPSRGTQHRFVGDQIYVGRTQLPSAMTARLIRLAAFQNPEFYRTQSSGCRPSASRESFRAPNSMVNAVNAQNLTLPSGTAKTGDPQYTVLTNATPSTIDELNDIPIKTASATGTISRLCASSMMLAF